MKYILLFFSITLFISNTEAQPTYLKRLSFNVGYNPYTYPEDSILHMLHFSSSANGDSYIDINVVRSSSVVYKIDLSGNILMQYVGNYKNTSSLGRVVALEATNDGGFVQMYNQSFYSQPPYDRCYLYKRDSLGVPEWTITLPPQNLGGYDYQIGYAVAILPNGYACLATDSIFIYNNSGVLTRTLNYHGPGTLYGFPNGDMMLNNGRIDSLGNILYILQGTVLLRDSTTYTIKGDTLHKIDAQTGSSFAQIYFPNIGATKFMILSDHGLMAYNSQQLFRYDSLGNLMWTKNITLPYFGINLVGEQSDKSFLIGGTYRNCKDYSLYALEYSSFISSIDSTGKSKMDVFSHITPGDGNNDNFFDVGDALYVALAQGSTGPSRIDTSVNNQITGSLGGDIAEDFPDSFAIGVNHKQCDMNSDGIIDSVDFATVSFQSALWQWLTPRTVPLRIKDPNTNQINSTLPFFSCLPERDSAVTGDTIRFHFILGDNGIAVDSIFGLAFNLLLDSTYTWDIAFCFNTYVMNSQLGNISDLRIENPRFTGTQNSLVIARRDLQNVYMVQDTIGYMDVQILDSTSGNIDLLILPICIRAITAGGFPVDLQFNTRPVHLRTLINEVPEITLGRIKLYPNPASDRIVLDGLPSKDLNIEILNYEGKKVFSGSNDKNVQFKIDLKNYIAGIYLIVIQDEGKNLSSRKFIKE